MFSQAAPHSIHQYVTALYHIFRPASVASRLASVFLNLPDRYVHMSQCLIDSPSLPGEKAEWTRQWYLAAVSKGLVYSFEACKLVSCKLVTVSDRLTQGRRAEWTTQWYLAAAVSKGVWFMATIPWSPLCASHSFIQVHSMHPLPLSFAKYFFSSVLHCIGGTLDSYGVVGIVRRSFG